MPGISSRNLRRATVAVLAAGLTGLIGGLADAEPQTQPGESRAGSHWEALEAGPDGMVGALAVFDEPGRPAGHPVLYAGGRFATAGGSPVRCIARWCDGQWSGVGQGVEGESVEALAVFDEDGPGPGQPALFVGGGFKKASGVSALNIARWNGAEWSAVGDGLDGVVIDLAVFDEDHEGPQPPALFAVGMFSRAGSVEASSIAKWNGQEWSGVGRGLAQVAFCAKVADPDGSGPAKPGLIVGCMNSVDLWNGTTWHSFGGPGFRTLALAAFDDNDDGRLTLYAGGQIMQPRAEASTTIARWDGKAWAPLPEALDERVYAMTVFDADADGPLRPALYVAGSFTKAGDRAAHGLACWDGSSWSILEHGPRSDPLTPRMNCLAVFDRDASDPRAPELCVGGRFTLDGQTKLRNVAVRSMRAPAPVPGSSPND
ncbi:MAG TPA: hypothetical protein PKK06_18295 [Phycisphaerae bacterium]|nr:hypothetical protein [Phycisphaerae bacterium]